MDDMNVQNAEQLVLENGDANSEIRRLLQMVEALTQEVRQLSEKVEALEQSPKQEKCVLCPHISIRIPIHFPISLPWGNITHKQ